MDFNYEREQGEKKKQQLLQFCDSHTIKPCGCVVIGDSDNDIEIFTLTGKGIAVYPAHPDLKSVAWIGIDDLIKVKDLL